jgi:hypothetical protein
MPSKVKKDFSNIGSIATSRFLSVDEEVVEEKVQVKETIPTKSKIKSKRLNLLIYPELFEEGSKIATMNKISFNEYLNKLIENDVNANQELIKMHDRVFKK